MSKTSRGVKKNGAADARGGGVRGDAPGGPDARRGAAEGRGFGGRVPRWVGAAGVMMGLVAIVATGALVFQHLTDRSLPGCGVASACSSLEAHPLGSLGGMRTAVMAVAEGKSGIMGAVRGTGVNVEKSQAVMPTSLIAASYFAALLAAWAVWWVGRRDAATLRWIRAVARAGVVGTVLFLVVIFVSGKYCRYCLVAHGANLVWWGVMEYGVWRSARSDAMRKLEGTMVNGRERRSSWGSYATGLAVFATALSVLGVMDADRRAEGNARSERAQAESRAAMLAQAERARSEAATQAASAGSGGTVPETLPWAERGFSGRWRLGPEKAVVRILLISDYQCHQCRRIEGEAMALQAKYPDKVSVSAKHFPLCADCNKTTGGQSPHPNACWAARAAEAAAMVAGANATLEGKDPWAASNESFWKMHRWLFSQAGSFTDASLPADLQKLGFEPKSFIKVMSSLPTLKVVQDDIEEAQLLGLSGTPMVWVNGIELKGWEAPRALEMATEAILGANPPALDAKADRPALASEKYVSDWRDQPKRVVPAEATVHALGRADAPVQIVVFGDFQEPNTAKVDALMRGMVADGKRPIRYIWRQFPGNKGCNPRVDRVIFDNGCTAAKAAEAAGVIGGEDAYWKLHAWMLANQTNLSLAGIKAGATSLGLDAEKLAAAMESPAVAKAVQEDIEASANLSVGQIPCVCVNGKWVQRWTREGDNVMERIVDEAARGAAAK